MYILLISIFFLLFAWHYKRKNNQIVSFVILFYAIAVFLGFLMTLHPMFKISGFDTKDIRIMPCAYLLCSSLILFLPLSKLSPSNNKTININTKRFILLCKFIIVISIATSILYLPHIGDAMNSLDFNEYKADIMEEGLNISNNNFFYEKALHLQGLFTPIIPFFTFYLLASIKNHSKLKILMLISMILPVILQAFAMAHRHILVYTMINILIANILFSGSLSKKIRKIIYLWTGIIIGATAFIVILFAFLRFDDGTNNIVTYSLLRYLGEPFVNFNTMLWDNDYYLYGNKSFPLFREILGFNTISINDIRDYAGQHVNYIPYYFYSIIGNFCMDFNPFIAFLLLSLVAYIFYYLINKKYKNNSFMQHLLIYLYATYTIQNYFYFQFQGNSNRLLIELPILILLINYYLKKSKSINKFK